MQETTCYFTENVRNELVESKFTASLTSSRAERPWPEGHPGEGPSTL